MHITFSSIKIRDLCECSSRAADFFGLDEAKILQRVLADLKAAYSLEELPPLYVVSNQGKSQIKITADGFTISANIMMVEVEKIIAIKMKGLKYE
ncbi:hypothetical protein [Xanthomonas hortorum]|uniref:Uncharacterized protein n=1 Tax=Xanthomonas hortorum pv. pelargonii TaxID=453602 RepID=A0AAW9ZVH4_9XANT|nr:hypothetical protein [Xanthomonas hortorum]MCE4354990.1 late competence development ComFB family protein [Xanthomonas hortorum pv. pelargonii]MCM5522962.1 late competence development ComFB family protein [Xanthomonas hortorum pv. pelargonii]MCM5535177.1 late competence development ComFB family protein [Xanthomonas hortorum pv. pelargonii]MCM5539306.1 late competence development ComFB family protein [Xanthomonas hortorum pv. pelargonii]MCM5547845.1 late competence development ComFB family pr